MTYENARSAEIHDAHQRVIDQFALTYRVGQPTVLLLPGGMGSHLDRSTKPFDGTPCAEFDPVWMDSEIFFGHDAVHLAINDDNHDIGDHLIVATGPLTFLVNAYNGTQKFFQSRGWNYLVFGYDWRRELAEAAGYLESFLTQLRYRVTDLRGVDLLPTLTMLAHSQGGLVAKVFLHRVAGSDGSGVAKWCERLVTVATPFYGTATHQDRYYIGQSPLNQFYGTANMARLAGTLQGPYILMTADEATLSGDTLQRLELPAYPMTDFDSAAPVDPYGDAALSRYPSWVKPQHLVAARSIRRTLHADLPAKALERVFHVRSGLDAKTGASLRWRNIKGSDFDPTQGNPVIPVPGKGDGTVPFWSARLAQTPKRQIYDLTKAKSHGTLCEHEETLKVLEYLIDKGRLPQPSRLKARDVVLGEEEASEARVQAFLAKAQSGAITKGDVEANDPAVWRSILNQATLC